MLSGKHILLIISGGIAAYKSLDLIRRLRERGCKVTPVLTKGGAAFVTPLSVSALAGAKVHEHLLDLTAEAEMGHIELSRAADLIVVGCYWCFVWHHCQLHKRYIHNDLCDKLFSYQHYDI